MNRVNNNIVIKVNQQDEILGYVDKMEAHFKGILHRAVSVFIINSNKEWLLQQRAQIKYHSGLLWSNACCTHPMKGENNLEAANRRLREEIGLKVSLTQKFCFEYQAKLDNDLVEHELDHIFIGYCDRLPIINPLEVADYRFVSPEDLDKELEKSPDKFTEWFKLLYQRICKEIEK